MSDKEIIREQQEKISEYERMLKSLLERPKMIGTAEAGPFKQDGTDFWRVKVGSQSVIVPVSPKGIFGDLSTLEPGSQVTLIEGGIVGVLPKELEKETKKLNIKLTEWDDIGGLKSQIDNIRQMVEMPLKHADLAKSFGIVPTKGMLLYGPPGCGKTLIAKAIASMILDSTSVDPRAFRYIKGAELLSMYVGATEQAIGELFRSCREYMEETGQQAVIFIDEAEAILPARGSRRSSDVETTIVPTFLSEMDGFDGNNPFLLLSTNLPNSIDEAILREGRIDVKVQINRPTEADAVEIFEIHLANMKCADKRNKLAEDGAKTLFASNLKHRVSGAMIQTIVNISAKNAMQRKIQFPKTDAVGITVEDITNALNLVDYESN